MKTLRTLLALAVVIGFASVAQAAIPGSGGPIPLCTLAAGQNQISIAGSLTRTCGAMDHGGMAAVIDAVDVGACSDIPGDAGGGDASLLVQWDDSEGASGEWKCVPASVQGTFTPAQLGQQAATDGEVICWHQTGGQWEPCSKFPPRIAWVAIPPAPSDPSTQYVVTDALGRCDISTAGSEIAVIIWDGAAWVPSCSDTGGAGAGTLTGITASTGGTAVGPEVTVVGFGTVATSRSGNTISITGTGDGVGVSGVSGDTGGTTSGATLTLAGGTNVNTVRSGDTLTINSTAGGGGAVNTVVGDTGSPTSGADVTIAGSGTVATSTSGDVVTITGTGDGQGVTGVAGDTGGTGTGATITVAGGTGLSSVRRAFSSTQTNRRDELEAAVKPHPMGGYSNHPLKDVTLVCGRPHSMGGPTLSFPNTMIAAFGIHTLEESADRICALVDEAPTDRLVFVCHNGPIRLLF